MKKFVMFTLVFGCITITAADSTITIPPSITVLLLYAGMYDIKPNSITTSSSGMGFRIKNTLKKNHECPVEVFTTRELEQANGAIVPAGYTACADIKPDNCLWQSKDTNTRHPAKLKIYYDNNARTKWCNCSFNLSMSPIEENNADFEIKFCADGLRIMHKAPFMLDGLESRYFENFTNLAIRNCQKLSGDKGALDTIIHHLKKLTFLDLSYTNLDKTEIDAEHQTLEVLRLRGCNCTAIKRLIMPKLTLLAFDDSALTEIDCDEITIGCPLSAIGCTLRTIRGTKKQTFKLVYN